MSWNPSKTVWTIALRWLVQAKPHTTLQFMRLSNFHTHVQLNMYYRGKVRYLNFCNFFIVMQDYNSLNFQFPGRCSKVLNLPWALGMSKKGNIFFYRFKTSYFSPSQKKHRINTWQIEKSHEFPGINSLSPISDSEFFYCAFNHTRLTLLVGISVVAIFVSHWAPAAKLGKKCYS